MQNSDFFLNGKIKVYLKKKLLLTKLVNKGTFKNKYENNKITNILQFLFMEIKPDKYNIPYGISYMHQLNHHTPNCPVKLIII